MRPWSAPEDDIHQGDTVWVTGGQDASDRGVFMKLPAEGAADIHQIADTDDAALKKFMEASYLVPWSPCGVEWKIVPDLLFDPSTVAPEEVVRVDLISVHMLRSNGPLDDIDGSTWTCENLNWDERGAPPEFIAKAIRIPGDAIGFVSLHRQHIVAVRPAIYPSDDERNVVRKMSAVLRAVLVKWLSVDTEVLRLPATMADFSRSPHRDALPRLVALSLHHAFISLSSHIKKKVWDKYRIELCTLSDQEYDRLHGGLHPLSPPLPAGWQAIWDVKDREFYYWHRASGRVQWEHPDDRAGSRAAGSSRSSPGMKRSRSPDVPSDPLPLRRRPRPAQPRSDVSSKAGPARRTLRSS